MIALPLFVDRIIFNWIAIALRIESDWTKANVFIIKNCFSISISVCCFWFVFIFLYCSHVLNSELLSIWRQIISLWMPRFYTRFHFTHFNEIKLFSLENPAFHIRVVHSPHVSRSLFHFVTIQFSIGFVFVFGITD